MITEDGTGLPLANSYVSPEMAEEYHELRENSAWAAAIPDARASALIRATDYIEATYRARGAPVSLDQGLQWPRLADYMVPAPVIAATALLALYALDGPLSSPAVRGTKSATKKLEGVGELSTVYDDEPSDPYPVITAMLADIATLKRADILIIARQTR